jgi:hypothetical protein
MQAAANKERGTGNTLLTITAKEGNAKDIAHMEKVVAFMIEQDGAEDIYGDDNNVVGLGVPVATCKEALEAYNEAKKATR